MLRIQLRQIILQVVPRKTTLAFALSLTFAHLHLSREASIAVSQGVHLNELGITCAYKLVVFVRILIEHEGCDAHGDRILHVLIDVIHGNFRAILALCLANLNFGLSIVAVISGKESLTW